MYGLNVHKAVLKNKEVESGITIHFVNEHYDKGPIIMQEKVIVKDNDNANTLSKKVLEKEYSLYIKAVNLFCRDKININNEIVRIND